MDRSSAADEAGRDGAGSWVCAGSAAQLVAIDTTIDVNINVFSKITASRLAGLKGNRFMKWMIPAGTVHEALVRQARESEKQYNLLIAIYRLIRYRLLATHPRQMLSAFFRASASGEK